jgi:sarcosine oxidase subunit alpha
LLERDVPKLVKEKDFEKGIVAGGRPSRLSPLHATHQVLGAQFVSQAAWQVPKTYTSPEDELSTIRQRVGLADVSSLGKLVVKGNAAPGLLAGVFDVTPATPGHMAPVILQEQFGPSLGNSYIARLAPDEFLIITPPGDEDNTARHIERKRAARHLFVTVINQTSGLAGLAVAGPHSREMLGKLCALPLSPRDFPNHRVAQSSLAMVHTIIVRNDLGNLAAFELYVERPYAKYVWTSLMDAGHEFGIIPFGCKAKELLEIGRVRGV